MDVTDLRLFCQQKLIMCCWNISRKMATSAKIEGPGKGLFICLKLFLLFLRYQHLTTKMRSGLNSQGAIKRFPAYCKLNKQTNKKIKGKTELQQCEVSCSRSLNRLAAGLETEHLRASKDALSANHP